METFRPKLCRLAWAWCHNSALADDLVQDTLLKGLQKLDQLRDPDQIEVWLSRILANLHRDYLRRRKEELGLEEDLLQGNGSPEQNLQQQDTISQVRHAIGCLNEDQRKVLTMVDLMEFSYADVANVLDIPVGTVMSRLCRARNRLKTLLKNTDSPISGVAHLRSVK